MTLVLGSFGIITGGRRDNIKFEFVDLFLLHIPKMVKKAPHFSIKYLEGTS